MAEVDDYSGTSVSPTFSYPFLLFYGKYYTLKRKYLEDMGLDLTIANLAEYLHGVDKRIC